jgi:hypothetical protein
MSNERELLKKALPDLRDYWDVVCDEDEESVTYKLIQEIEAELAKPEAEPAEVAVSMKAIRFAWEGNIKAADYIELMASRLEEHQKSDSAQYVRDFLAELKGEKKPTFIVPTEYSLDNSKQEAEPRPMWRPYETLPRSQNFNAFIRAFWRRINAHKNDFGKELPEEMPVQFRASMETALLIFDKDGSGFHQGRPMQRLTDEERNTAIKKGIRDGVDSKHGLTSIPIAEAIMDAMIEKNK